MKSMKKIFIGLAAVAAMGVSALCFSNSKSPEILSKNVSVLAEAYCAYQPDDTCILQWLDGDSFTSNGFCKVGKTEVEIAMENNPDRRLWNFYNNMH